MRKLTAGLPALCAACLMTAQDSNFVYEGDCMQLHAPAEASVSTAAWPSEAVEDASWSLRFTLSFVPSTSNYFRWHLTSDTSAFAAKSEGFCVQVGKQISLLQTNAGKNRKLVVSEEVVTAAGEYGLEVEYREGAWSLRCFNAADSLLFEAEAQARPVAPSRYAGVECVYTKTRSEGFRFCGLESTGNPYRPPWQPQPSDLLLNELLSYPLAGGCDYVELYNASDSTVELSLLQLDNGKTVCGLPEYGLSPGDRVLLTSCPEQVEEAYPYADPEVFVSVPKLPAFASDSGLVRLSRSDGQLLDSLVYHRGLHNRRLESTRGVALERIEGTSVWTSAGSAYHYGSPGLPNPVVQTGGQPSQWGLQLLCGEVTPNGDGVDDRLGLRLQFERPTTVHVSVCSLYGHTLAVLAEGVYEEPEYVWWDVVDALGRGLPPGIYLLVCELFDDGGGRCFKKIPFVVAS